VVVQEVVVREGFEALFRKPACGRRHVRAAGSDFAPGEVLLDAGARLTPGALVAAAGADLGEVTVFARPRVAVLATGDELAEPGQASERAGAAPDSVSLGVAAMTPLWGGRVVARARLGDALKTLREAAAKAVASADVVVVTGGASGGERDYARAMFQPLGLELVFNGVAMKPGKPVWMGRVGRTTIVGLPGNPSAAMITARLFLAPVLARLAGRPASDAWQWRLQRLAGALGESGERECFLKASARPEGVRPLLGQDSSGQKDLAAADLLIRRRPGARALRAGEFVETLAF
jgi:molybdopterin molybdotransferase